MLTFKKPDVFTSGLFASSYSATPQRVSPSLLISEQATCLPCLYTKPSQSLQKSFMRMQLPSCAASASASVTGRP